MAQALSRTLRIEYVGASGRAQETEAVLLDWCGAGLLNVAGGKTLLSWDRLVLAELAEDR